MHLYNNNICMQGDLVKRNMYMCIDFPKNENVISKLMECSPDLACIHEQALSAFRQIYHFISDRFTSFNRTNSTHPHKHE